MKFHKDHTEPTNPEAIFVFGSNLKAAHGGGAAKLAADKYGAHKDVAEGLSGRSYAIPTKDLNIETLPLQAVQKAVATFIEFAKANPQKEFFMTRIGCVLAGYTNADIAPMFKGAPSNIDFPEEWKDHLKQTALVLRTCRADMSSRSGFIWPGAGETATAPDWQPTNECGHGLHGWLYGQGDHSASYYTDQTAKWLVVEVDLASVVMLGGKCKFKTCVVRFVGSQKDATDYILANEPQCANVAVIGAILEVGDSQCGQVGALGTLTGGHDSTLTGGNRSTLTGGHDSTLTGGHDSTLTGGNRSTLTGGNRSTLTGGDGSTLTGGHDSTLTGGDGSTLTGGDGSTLTGGYGSTLTGGDGSTLTGGDGSTLTGGDGSTLTGGDGSTLIIKYWDGERYRAKLAEVGENGILPNVAYKLNDKREFEKVRV
jgi:hypothetical protein